MKVDFIDGPYDWAELARANNEPRAVSVMSLLFNRFIVVETLNKFYLFKKLEFEYKI